MIQDHISNSGFNLGNKQQWVYYSLLNDTYQVGEHGKSTEDTQGN